MFEVHVSSVSQNAPFDQILYQLTILLDWTTSLVFSGPSSSLYCLGYFRNVLD